MALKDDLKKLEAEIKTKQAAWFALSEKAADTAQSLTAEETEQLTAGNKALSEMVDKKVALQTLIVDEDALKAKLDMMTAAEKAAIEKARSSLPKEEEQKSWVVNAAKAMVKDFPTKQKPYTIEKSLKALFNEGAFTAASGTTPGFYVPANTQGYPPELRRDDSLFTPDAVRPVQFWNTIMQISTDRPTDVFMRETVNADSSDVFVGEGGAYVEDDGFDYNEFSNPIKDVGTYYAVTRDILEDEPMMMNVLEMRMMERISRKIDNACLNNASGTNKFAGVLMSPDHPTFAKGEGDSLQVAITRAVEAVNGPAVTGIANSGGQAMADMIYVTVPIYWEFMRQQDALGNFMVSMGLREAPQLRVAGVPVVQCQALPSGNILVMDRMFTHIRDRRMVEVYWMERMAVASTHTVPTAQRMVVADARLTISVRRPAANCSITGA